MNASDNCKNRHALRAAARRSTKRVRTSDASVRHFATRRLRLEPLEDRRLLTSCWTGSAYRPVPDTFVYWELPQKEIPWLVAQEPLSLGNLLVVDGDATPGEIHGAVWEDVEVDGIRELGEPGMPGVTVYLDLNNNGELNSTDVSQTTRTDDPATPEDETGTFAFTELSPGSYFVRVDAPGWRRSIRRPSGESIFIPEPDERIVLPGESVVVNIGIYTPPLEVVSVDPSSTSVLSVSPARVMLDFNVQFDPSTLESSDFSVNGTSATGVQIVDADTVAFDLPLLTDGRYTVAVDAGAMLSAAGVPNEAFSSTFIVNDPEVFVPAKIHGLVWEDPNGNDVRDPGEPGLAGMTVVATRTDVNSDPLRVATRFDDPQTAEDETGRYAFTGLERGSYRISQEVAAGWKQTFPMRSWPGVIRIDSPQTDLVASASVATSIIHFDPGPPEPPQPTPTHYVVELVEGQIERNKDFANQRLPFQVAETEPARAARFNAAPEQIFVRFNFDLDPASVDPSDLTVDGTAATAVSILGDSGLRFDLPPLADGRHEIEIAAGAIISRQGTLVRAYHSDFVLDLTPPRVVASSLQENAIVTSGSLVYTAQFDEPMDNYQLDGNDVALVGTLTGTHTPNRFRFDFGTRTVTVEYQDLPDDRYALFLRSGELRFRDLVGHPLDGEPRPDAAVPSGDGVAGGDFCVHFTVDADRSDAFPPMAAYIPLGSLIYQSHTTGVLLDQSDTDTYHLTIDPDQTISLMLESGPGMMGSIQVEDSHGTVVATGSADLPGRNVIVQTVPSGSDAAETYTITVGSLPGSNGAYALRAIVNAALEEEQGELTNDTLPSAQNLDGSFVPLVAGSAARGAVLGSLPRVVHGEDWYQFTLAAGQSGSLVLTGVSPATMRLELYDREGILLATGIASGEETLSIPGFTAGDRASSASHLYARVSGSGGRYSLLVLRDANVDSEPAGSPLSPVLDITRTGTALGYANSAWSGGAISAQGFVASDAAAQWLFGSQVSISGNVAVIGAPGSGANGYRAGAAYIYRFDGGQWLEEQRLLPSDAGVLDWFGSSVSISGDTAIVGAYGNDDAGSRSGSAYVFRFNGAHWTEEQKLTASDATEGAEFGSAVTIQNNVAVIGAPGDSERGHDAGAVYVFRYTGEAWTQDAKLTASDAGPHDLFGGSVALDGNTLVIGAAVDYANDASAGAAYVYRFESARWMEYQKLTASDGERSDRFGDAVGVSGDVAIVGAPGKSSVYVFRFDRVAWALEGKLSGARGFGDAVCLHGDNVIIGALGTYSYAGTAGVVSLFHYNGGQWVRIQDLSAGYNAPADGFGNSVALNGDMALVGAPLTNAVGGGSGAVYALGGLPSANRDLYRFRANAGDELLITTRTPADGPGEFFNTTDPRVELYDPSGALVAGDDNGAADGRNARLEYTAPVSGAYTVRVLAAEGTWLEYVLSVSGHTGEEPAFEVTGFEAADGEPASRLIVDFNDAVYLPSLEASDLRVDGVPAVGFTIVDGDTVAFDLPAASGDRVRRVEIAAGAVEDLQRSPVEAFAAAVKGRAAIEDLGPVDFVVAENVTLQAGEHWYRLEASRNGILTVEAWGEDLQLVLYDSSGVARNDSSAVGNIPRVDWQVRAGEVFYVHISGAAEDFDLRITNLVQQEAGAVTIHGTAGDDPFTFDASTGLRMTIHGTMYDFTGSGVVSFSFQGGNGSDEVTLIGSDGVDRAQLRRARALLQGEGYTVIAAGMESCRFDGGEGDDFARLYGPRRACALTVEQGSAAGPARVTLTAGGTAMTATAETIYVESGDGGRMEFRFAADRDDSELVWRRLPRWGRTDRWELGSFEHMALRSAVFDQLSTSNALSEVTSAGSEMFLGDTADAMARYDLPERATLERLAYLYWISRTERTSLQRSPARNTSATDEIDRVFAYWQ